MSLSFHTAEDSCRFRAMLSSFRHAFEACVRPCTAFAGTCGIDLPLRLSLPRT